MNPNFDNLRNCRDFLSRLLDLPPNQVIDLLANAGENQVALFNEALGREAFKVGDPVIVEMPDTHEFQGTVDDIRADSHGVNFTVKDQDDNAFDCEAGELRPNQD